MENIIYIGYQNNKLWGAFENEKSAISWASEFPEDRVISQYRLVCENWNDEDLITKGNI